MNIMEEICELRIEAVFKFWQMISKSTQLTSICSTVNKELQDIWTGDLLHNSPRITLGA